MFAPAVTVALPIANRQASYDFYHHGLEFTAPGEPDKDGLPEPLRLILGDRIRIMLIPNVGFGWVLSGRKRAPGEQSWGYDGAFADPDGHVWHIAVAGQFLTTWP